LREFAWRGRGICDHDSCFPTARAQLPEQPHFQLADVTDHYTIIRLRGTHARQVLMKLTTLDMHPRAFAEGAVKGSIFGRVQAKLHLPAGESAGAPGFDLIVRWSHADYLWCLIALGGREYGLPEQVPAGRVTLAVPSRGGAAAS
jgi:heterotetrameric sarcosine oxidase gamma subunit